MLKAFFMLKMCQIPHPLDASIRETSSPLDLATLTTDNNNVKDKLLNAVDIKVH